MKKIKNRSEIKFVAFTIMILSVSSCTLDYINPNSPSEVQALGTRDGLISLSTGMRQFYSTQGLEALILTPGTTAREVKGISTFTNIIEIEAGGTGLPNFNGNVLNVWSRMYRVTEAANEIMENVPVVLNAEDISMSTSMIAHAKLFKAMALGGLAISFEKAPVDTQEDGLAEFLPRQQLLTAAIAMLNEAGSALAANPPNAEVGTRLLGVDFDLVNCVRAMQARFNLMAGNYQAAIDAANSVDLTKKSEFKYTALSLNQVYVSAVTGNNYRPRKRFGFAYEFIEDADARINFYMGDPFAVLAGDTVQTFKGFFSTQTTSIPVYIPDEMKLIRAEASVRLNGAASIPDAIVDINAVRTQSTGDPFGVYANLPIYGGALTEDAVLLEIFKQRSAELYMSGLRLEDSRRFNRPGPPGSLVERNRNFYPYPSQERTTNTNTPPDPEI